MEILRTQFGTQEFTFNSLAELRTAVSASFTHPTDRAGESFYTLNDIKAVQHFKDLDVPLDLLINIIAYECIINHINAKETSKRSALNKLTSESIDSHDKLISLMTHTYKKFHRVALENQLDELGLAHE